MQVLSYPERLAACGKVADVARQILARLPSAEHDELRQRTLEVYLRELPSRRSWWKRHPAATQALARLLDVTEAWLLEDAAAPAPTPGLPFADFPALPPLVPSTDDSPFHEPTVGWLGQRAETALAVGGHTWVQAPAGSGKHLVVAWCQARFPKVTCLRAATLHDLVAQASPGSALLACVERSEPGTDPQALLQLSRRKQPVCVLAGFRLSDTCLRAAPDWQQISWRLPPGWRLLFARWVRARLGNAPTSLDPEAVCRWVRAVDPAGAWFRTPGELLPVLAWAHLHGTPRGKQRALARLASETWASRRASLAQHGQLLPADLLSALVWRRWTHPTFGHHPLAMADWRGLLSKPEALDRQHLAWQIQQLALTKESARRRKEGKQLAAEVIGSAASRHLDMALETGLLRSQQDGLLQVYPTWMGEGWVRKKVCDTILREEPEAWGPWAACATRRPTVDAVLDSLTDPRWQQLIQPLSLNRIGTLAHDAAVEALFAAVGRRALRRHHAVATSQSSPSPAAFTSRWQPAPAVQQQLRRLAELQWSLLRVCSADEPVTRARLRSSPRACPWLAEAWAFSFLVPAPEPPTAAWAWTFPGWERPALDQVPAHLPEPFLPQHNGEARPRQVWWQKKMLLLSELVLQRCQIQALPAQIPALLLPRLVRRLAFTSHAGSLFVSVTSPEPSRVLREFLVHPGLGAEPKALAAALWEAGSHHKQGNMAAVLDEATVTNRLLLQAMLQNIDPAMFGQVIKTHPAMLHAEGLDDLFPLLPPFLQQIIKKAFLQITKETQTVPTTINRPFAGWFWRHNPAAAWVETEQALRLGYGAIPWIFGAPTLQRKKLLLLLRMTKNTREPLTSWLQDQLTKAGPRARPVYESLVRPAPQ